MTESRRTAAEQSVAAMTGRHPSIVLAVSGGLDSTCLAHMAHAVGAEGARLLVATFDHRTGSHGARAVEHVVALATQLGLPVEIGRSERTGHSEDEWRADRWRFLRDVASRHDAVVATAHTRDDHLETVVMRILRGAGARGLAGLMADTPSIARPLVHTSRAALANYAKLHGLTWVDDPTNESRRFFRNRVRLDLLPALRHADPSLADDLLSLSHQAGALRRDMESLVASWVTRRTDGVFVSEVVLGLHNAETRAAAWPAILGPRHLVLDRRGIVRLATLDLNTERGSAVTLSGGWHAARVSGGVRLRQSSARDASVERLLPECGRAVWAWRFEVFTGATRRCA
jgi:tRNA(Ile)-lysidine synthase